MALNTFKNHFIDLTKVVFLDVHKVGSEFLGPFTYIKHQLTDVVQIAFFEALDVKMCSHDLLTP
jgi:hypothetical protein